MSEENQFEQEQENKTENNEIDGGVLETSEATEAVEPVEAVEEQLQDNCEDAIAPPTDDESAEQPAKKKIKISLSTYIVSVVAFVLATLMITYSICGSIYKRNLAQIYNELGSSATDKNPTTSTDVSEKNVIDFLLEQYFYGEIDKDALTEESLKAYLAATGDIYAAYYTQEEIDAANQEGAGKMQGIGVNIINSTVEISGVKYAVLKITNVMKDSPAQEQGLKAGDLVFSVVEGEKKTLVNELGYDEALKRLKGVSGTVASFSILRKSGDGYEEKYFAVTRREVITESVYYRTFAGDSKIGIIRILDFELNTPTQFQDAVEALKKQGCERYVIDVRYNPGGYLISIAAVLSYFLNEGDVYIRTEDKAGNITSKTVGVIDEYEGDYAPCNVSKSDIGKYKDLNMVVLCNEYTASAAELFTATFRDYALGKIVGTTTFGKGKMQTTYSLAAFGLNGAVKFTTHMYYSAKSEGYDGIGIKPDAGCDIPLSEEAKQYNIYDLPDNLDNQLLEAIKHFK